MVTSILFGFHFGFLPLVIILWLAFATECVSNLYQREKKERKTQLRREKVDSILSYMFGAPCVITIYM